MEEGIVDKIVSALEARADILGMLYGFLADPLGGGRGLAGAPGFMIDRISRWAPVHPGDVLRLVISWPHVYPFTPGITAAIGGYILREVAGELDPKIMRLGNFLKKFGVSTAVSSIIAGFLWLPGLLAGSSSSPSSSSSHSHHSSATEMFVYR